MHTPPAFQRSAPQRTLHALNLSVALCLFAGCGEPNTAFDPTIVTQPTVVDLGLAVRGQPAPQSFVQLENTGGTVMYVSAAAARGDNGTPDALADLIQLDLPPFTPVFPEQTELVPVSLDHRVWRWQSSDSAEVIVPLEIRYHFAGQRSDQGEPDRSAGVPEPVFRVDDLLVTFSINCDLDDDGSDSTRCGGPDCDDNDALIGPHAVEHCDGIDEDCDGARDEDVPDAPQWFPDSDRDGYGNGDLASESSCFAPPGDWADNPDDCDDTTVSVRPSAIEQCSDTIDNNCNGDVDEDDIACQPEPVPIDTDTDSLP